MRRPSPALTRHLPEISPPRQARDHLRQEVVLALQAITPIIGGGVEASEPDVVDVVRVPAIRGQLRRWWRTLYHEARESVDTLYRREAELWGGVDLPVHQENEPRARRSRVVVSAQITDPGKVEPAGWHDSRGGWVKAFPRWSIGAKLGYALFPLQVDKEERAAHRGSGGLPTRAVRTGLRFRLRLEVTGTEDEAKADENLRQVLGALWAWVHFGGLGARTRRGFGALEVVAPLELRTSAESVGRSWLPLFHSPDPGAARGWSEQAAQLGAFQPGPLTSLRMMVGAEQPNVGRAHEELVDLLRIFRQGGNVGRDPGDRRPGRSRWPEAHLLRVLRDPDARYAHPPDPEIKRLVLDRQVGTPRAAFGLPLQFQFKDPADQYANARLLPLAGSRRPSPLLLRPYKGRTGYYPAVVLLDHTPPQPVRVQFGNHTDEKAAAGQGAEKSTLQVAARSVEGARPPIAKFLHQADGNAVEAFLLWLESRGYRTVSAGTPGESR